MPRSELALARMRHRLPAFGQTFGCRWSRRLRDSVPVPSRRSIWGGQALTFWSSRFRRVSIFVFVVVMIIDVVIRYGEFKKGKMWKFAWREKDIQFWCPILQSVISNHTFALTVGAKIRMSLVASSGRYRQRGRYIQGRYTIQWALWFLRYQVDLPILVLPVLPKKRISLNFGARCGVLKFQFSHRHFSTKRYSFICIFLPE